MSRRNSLCTLTWVGANIMDIKGKLYSCTDGTVSL
jgi:hypothetical protein